MKQAASMKKQRMSSKDAWKLLILLIGFMILLGLSSSQEMKQAASMKKQRMSSKDDQKYWKLLSHGSFCCSVVGADTNIYAAFAIQWLFVFFNSLQGFFIFFFFIVINPDMWNEWKTFLTASCSFKNKEYSRQLQYRWNQLLTISALLWWDPAKVVQKHSNGCSSCK